MGISCVVDAIQRFAQGLSMRRRFVQRSVMHGLDTWLIAVLLGGAAMAQGGPLVLERNGRVISLVPYAPNVLRVTMSTDQAAATAAPGYGIVAMPSATGWKHEQD